MGMCFVLKCVKQRSWVDIKYKPVKNPFNCGENICTVFA